MDVAAGLCERELSSIQVQVEKGLTQVALKTLDERGGAQELVRQQYTGRYPFELLQNANDAAQETGNQGCVLFLLTDSSLIVADNGIGFGEDQVEAICSLGRSSKSPGESVGHKGLGFKSVGEITDHPQVISSLTSFQFSREKAFEAVRRYINPLPASQRLPLYAFPFPIEEDDLGPDAMVFDDLKASGYRTIIRLPLRPNADHAVIEADLLNNLHPRLLLFLPHVDFLELKGTHKDFKAKIFRDADAVAEHAVLKTNEVDERWIIYRDSIIPEKSILEPLGEQWMSVSQFHFAIAVPLDEDALPRVDEAFPLHVYFPTEEEPGLHVAIHADWILTMDRRQIANTPEALKFNQTLMRSAVEHLMSTVTADLIDRTNSSKESVEILIPTPSSAVGTGGATFRKLWISALEGVEFLPTVDGIVCRPTEIALLPRKLPNVEKVHELASLDSARTLRPDIEHIPAVTNFLRKLDEVDELDAEDLLNLFREPTTETIDNYYAFLVEWWELDGKKLVDVLKQSPCVLSTSGNLLTPDVDTIFFPREKDDGSFPEDLPVPIACIPNVKGAQKLLRELGVRAFEWRELIRDYLIEILDNPDSPSDLRERAFKGLRAYHKVRLGGSEELRPILSRVLLPSRSADGVVKGLEPASNIYFGTAWSGSSDLETIYGPFDIAEFLDIEPPDDSELREDEISFYSMLGVADHARLDEATATEKDGYLITSGRHPHRGVLFRRWMEHPDVIAASRCPQGHPQTQQLKSSFQLDRHEAIIESQNPVRLIALWNQLARKWGAIYESGTQATFACVNTSHIGDRKRTGLLHV